MLDGEWTQVLREQHQGFAQYSETNRYFLNLVEKESFEIVLKNTYSSSPSSGDYYVVRSGSESLQFSSLLQLWKASGATNTEPFA